MNSTATQFFTASRTVLTTTPTVGSHDYAHAVEPQTAYVLCGITYIPHYTRKGTFVAPGNVMYTEDFLGLLGASQITLDLWPRHYS